MSKQPVRLGHLAFDSKKSGDEHFQRLRKRYKSGQRITGQDELDVRAALDAHPDREEKVAGQPVSHFELRRYKFGRPAIFLVREDGSAVDVSVERAIGIRP